MLETLMKGFKAARQKISGIAELNEANIEEALRLIRISLLEADVEFHVVKNFLEKMKTRAVGELVTTRVTYQDKKMKVTPGDHFIKICHDELIALMGEEEGSFNLKPDSMYTMMLVGLHGCGKTTTAAKLAKMLQKKERKPLLVAADVYRPAAVQQLKILGEKIEIPVFSLDTVPPPDLCRRAQDFARENGRDSIIIDTAGRLTIDSELMSELEQIKFQTKPDDIILVVDAMIGQDSVRMASEFNRRLSVSGFILTKMDGDARGGSALSIREVTGKPIKFITTGETLEKLEEFRAEGLASRILGLGDIVGLVKEFEEVVDEKKAEEEALRMLKGDFTLINFLEQIKAIKKMGPLRDVLEKMPFFSEAIPEGAAVDEKVFVRIEAMINSMTHMERLKPEIIDENRAKRIAKGSGTSVSDIFDLMKRFNVMKDVMKRLGKMPGLLAKIPGFRELFQLHKMKGMDLGDMMPDEGGDLEERRKKKTMRLIDLEKRRRKEKMARLARKKARRRR